MLDHPWLWPWGWLVSVACCCQSDALFILMCTKIVSSIAFNVLVPRIKKRLAKYPPPRCEVPPTTHLPASQGPAAKPTADDALVLGAAAVRMPAPSCGRGSSASWTCWSRSQRSSPSPAPNSSPATTVRESEGGREGPACLPTCPWLADEEPAPLLPACLCLCVSVVLLVFGGGWVPSRSMMGPWTDDPVMDMITDYSQVPPTNYHHCPERRQRGGGRRLLVLADRLPVCVMFPPSLHQSMNDRCRSSWAS